MPSGSALNPRRKKKNLFSRVFLHQAVLPLIGLAVLALIAVPLLDNIKKQHEVKTEISELEEEIRKLEAGNLSLSELLKYIESDEFAEKQARLNLNYRLEGEQVVVIKEKEGEAEANFYDLNNHGGRSGRQASESGNLPNRAKWWNYFFN